MGFFRSIAQGARTGLQAFTILSEANSFEENRVLGSKRLNALGLHRWRVRAAARLTSWRRARLSPLVRREWRQEFADNGFVMIDDVLPEEDFNAMRAALMEQAWPVRDMVQGNTITRRAPIDANMMRSVPALERLFSADWFRGLVRYVSSYDVEPLHYVQAIIKKPSGGADPQLSVHADTFHSSMKAWLFLQDVEPGDGAFTYVRGSHRLTAERLEWEDEIAKTLPEGGDRLTRRGSFRVSSDDLEQMGLPQPEELAVKANTLVVADTFGFHARGPSGPELARVELWSYSRRNPFLPWLGGDILSLPFVAPRRVGWLWKLRDRFPKLLKQPWRPVGRKRMTELP